MWTVSDDALVAGLASGDRDAASAFVRRFQRRVFGLARTIVADDRAAEDIAQEAFVRAWKHAAAYDPRRGNVAGWLLTITRNLAIDAVRVRRPIAYDPDALLGLDQPSGDRGPADLAALVRRHRPAARRVDAVAGGAGPRHRARRSPGPYRAGGRRDRGHPARHREDAHPHRADPTPCGARERGAG